MAGMDAAIAAALHRKAVGNRDFTDTLMNALKEVAEQSPQASWAPKPRNPLLPESDVESIAGLPPGDTPRSAWLASGRFDRALPGEDEEGSDAGVAHMDVDESRRTGSGGGEVAAGPSRNEQQYSRGAASDAGTEEEEPGRGKGYLEAITTTLLPSVVGFGLALLVSGATMPLIRPRNQRVPARRYRGGSSDVHREEVGVFPSDNRGEPSMLVAQDHADAADFAPPGDGPGETHADA